MSQTDPFQDFKQQAIKCGALEFKMFVRTYYDYFNSSYYDKKREERNIEAFKKMIGGESPIFAASRVLDGYSGGNCWGDEAERFVSDEPEPQLKTLDSFLEQVVPNISFLQYKKMVNSIQKRIEYEEIEFYGNSTRYEVKFVSVGELYVFLKNQNLL